MPLMLAITARVRPPRYTPRVVAAPGAAPKQAVFALVPAALGLLALILTVAEVQTVGAAIVPGCFGNRGLSCRGTKISNPSPSSSESANFQYLSVGVISQRGRHDGSRRRSSRLPVSAARAARLHEIGEFLREVA